MTADIGPVVAAVEQAERDHQWTHGWGCTCGNSGGDPEHIRAEVAKAAMDAARPLILREIVSDDLRAALDAMGADQ